VHEIDAGHHFEQFTENMVSRADALERAIERSQRPLKLIDAKPVEPHPASELNGPFPRMKRRV